MRYGFTSTLLAALLFVPSVDAAAQTSARTSDGKPNLQGIWQVLNTAAWDIQDHSARLGVPAGQGIVVGNDIPYTPAALAKKRQKQNPGQLKMFDDSPNPALTALKGMQVDNLSPIEALTKLYELKRMADDS